MFLGRTVATKCAAGSSLQGSMVLWGMGFRGRKGSTNEYGICILNSLLFFLIKQEKSNVGWGIMILSCITYLPLQIKVMVLLSNLLWRSCVWTHRSLKAQKIIQQPRQVFWHLGSLGFINTSCYLSFQDKIIFTLWFLVNKSWTNLAVPG